MEVQLCQVGKDLGHVPQVPDWGNCGLTHGMGMVAPAPSNGMFNSGQCLGGDEHAFQSQGCAAFQNLSGGFCAASGHLGECRLRL
jgi:hypothetical protein